MLPKKPTQTRRKPSLRARSNTAEPDEGMLAPNAKHGNLRAINVGEGLPSLSQMMEEIQDMTDVLIGRAPSPIRQSTIALMETADAYFARASEMTMLIQHGERVGVILKGSGHYKFRTGELRTFTEIAKRAADLGSRRLTEEQLQFEMERFGRESKGGTF